MCLTTLSYILLPTVRYIVRAPPIPRSTVDLPGDGLDEGITTPSFPER